MTTVLGMKKRGGFVSTVALLALVIAACGGGGESGESSTTSVDEATSTSAEGTTTTSDGATGSTDPVTLGILTPLSQPGDPGSGQFIGRGAELAKEWVEQRIEPDVWDDSCAMPASLNLVTFDDEGTPERGVAGVRSLVQNDDAAAIIGQIHSAVMIAVAPFADEFEVPIFAATASATDISSAGLKYVFQSHAITSDRAEAVGSFIEASDEFSRVAIVAENSDYGIGNVDDLKERLAGVDNLEVRDWVFDKESVDLTPLLLDVKTFDPDVIFNVSSTETEYLMVAQADDVGLLDTAAMIISDDRPVRDEFWENVGDSGQNAMFVTYYHPDQALTTAGEWFKEQYTARHGEEPVYTAYQGFGNAIIVAQAVNRACSVEGSDLVDVLENGPFVSWNTDGVSFPQADGVDWHRIRIPILLLQYTEASQYYGDANIVYPDDLATADPILP